MVKYKIYYVEDGIKKEQELESNKSIAEVFDEFEQGKVWRVDILEDNVKVQNQYTTTQKLKRLNNAISHSKICTRV